YWETTPPTISEKNQSRTFFTQKATPQFLRSIARFREFPESDVPEVAFVGRSNVGKSSLLNALVNSNAGTKSAILARTSATPGCTRTMNLYGLGPKDGGVRIKPGKNNGHDRIVGVGGVLLVDLPGYGEGSLAEWGAEIMKYLTRRKQLRRVFVLVDALHGVKEKDLSLLAALRLAGVPHQVVLSKVDRVYVPKAKRLDRISKGVVSKLVQPLGTLEEARERMLDVKETIQPAVGAGALGELLSVSAEVRVDENRLGVDGVRFAILRAAGFRFEVESASGKQKMGKFSAGSRSVYVPSQREHVSAVDGKKNKMVWA
ncbi:GTP-binding protein engB, partial [Dendryphion nanum]